MTSSSIPEAFRAAVLTVSDSGARGERNDISGPAVAKTLEKHHFSVIESRIVADDHAAIMKAIVELARKARLVVTTGGTGLSPRDVTPEATLAVVDRHVPGIAELMRLESLKITPRSALSRAVSGIRQSTLIINLPGSVKGVRECLTAVRPILSHAVEVLKLGSVNCGET